MMSSPMQSDNPASVEPRILGRFVLLERLGQGGMGVVYAAYDPKLDRRVALKLLRPGRGRPSARQRERLVREAQALARLAHPHVVPIHDVGVIDDQVFLVMEYIAGKNLRAWAAQVERDKDRARPWQEILDVYCQAGRGLAAAHAAGIVHRDFKPENVIMGEDGRVRVLDFGVARTQPSSASGDSASGDSGPGDSASGDSGPGDSGPGDSGPRDSSAPSLYDAITSPRGGMAEGDPTLGDTMLEVTRSISPAPVDAPLTKTGALLGTPAYMAPEQYDGAAVGPAADQFSFCVALYEALYGQKPFAAGSLRQRKEAMQKGAVIPPPQGTQVPGWMFAVLSRGLRRLPEERYPSMGALLDELSRDREDDLSLSRRAAMRYFGGFGAGSLALTLLVRRWFFIEANDPVSLDMLAINLGLFGAFVAGLVLARRALMVNDMSRKLVLIMGASALLIMCQRLFGWVSGWHAGHQFAGELFSICAAAGAGAITLSRRLVPLALCAFSCTVAIVVWPELLSTWLCFGYSTVLGCVIWVWSGERAEAGKRGS